VVVHVDEAGGRHEPPRVDHALGLRQGEIPNARDSACEQPDVRLEARGARTIDDRTPSDEQIEALLGKASGGEISSSRKERGTAVL
jgi:hypothetical protein